MDQSTSILDANREGTTPPAANEPMAPTCPFTFTGKEGKRRAIVFYPDINLSGISCPVVLGLDNKFDAYVHEVAADLVATARATKAAGISAVQVGENVRVICVETAAGQYSVFVNPAIVKFDSEKVLGVEGCLSFPGAFEQVERSAAVRVNAQTIDGETFEADYSEQAARALQHEVEHLDGILFIQHLPIWKRDTIRQRMKKVTRTGTKLSRQGVALTRAVFGYEPGTPAPEKTVETVGLVAPATA